MPRSLRNLVSPAIAWASNSGVLKAALALASIWFFVSVCLARMMMVIDAVTPRLARWTYELPHWLMTRAARRRAACSSGSGADSCSLSMRRRVL